MRWLLCCFCLLAESYETINHYLLKTIRISWTGPDSFICFIHERGQFVSLPHVSYTPDGRLSLLHKSYFFKWNKACLIDKKSVNYNVKCKVLKLWQTASISAVVGLKGKYNGELRKNNLKSSAGLSHLNYICLAKNARKRFRALHDRHKIGCSTTLVLSL